MISATPSQQQGRLQVYLALAIIYVVWGSTYLAIRFAVQSIPPLLMAGSRYLVAGALLFIFVWARRTPMPTLRQVRDAFIIGFLLLLCGNGGVALAEETVPSNVAALLAAIVPLWFVLGDWLLFKGTKPGWMTMGGLLLGFVGIALLLGKRGHATQEDFPVADAMLIVIGSIAWSIGSLFAARKADQPSSPFMNTALQMLCGGLLLTLSSFFKGEFNRFDSAAVTSGSFQAWIYLVIFGSILAFTAYGWLVRNAPPKLVSTYAYVNPVIAVLLGWGLGNEGISARSLFGAAVIVASVMIISSRSKKRIAPPIGKAA